MMLLVVAVLVLVSTGIVVSINVANWNQLETQAESVLDILAENYYASVYRGKAGSAAYNAAIRDWLNENTGGLLKEQAEGKGKKQGNQRNENALELQSERLHRIPSFKLPYIIQHFQAKRQQILSISAERMGMRKQRQLLKFIFYKHFISISENSRD